jgi:hypothetical protein
MQDIVQQMMAKVRLRRATFEDKEGFANAFGFNPGTLEAANRPCLCATCKAVVLERIKVERGESDEGRLQLLAGKYDRKCQLHALQALYK